MKTLLLLLLTCLPLWAATTYPMLSTTTNRTVTGGTTNLSLLNANQTFTGTNTFPAASFYPANNIGMRLLWSSPTNIYISSMVVAANKTNSGDFASLTAVASMSVPALLGSNSSVNIVYTALRTNANATAGELYFYAGANTNFMAHSQNFFATTAGQAMTGGNLIALQNAGAFTNQIVGSLGAYVLQGIVQIVDTSTPWTLYLGCATSSTHTNSMLVGLRIYELFAP